MGVENKTVQIREICYYLFFGLMLFAKGIGLYDGQLLYKLFLLAAFFFLACKLVLTPYTVRERLAIAAILVVSGLAFLNSGEKGILICAAVVVGMKGISLERIMKLSMYVWTVAFVGITVLSQFRLHNTLYKVHDKLGLGHIFRWGLGYPHPNVLHISFLILLIFYLYVREKKFNWKTFAWMFAANLVVFFYSVSYTGVVIVTIYLLGNLYWAYRGRMNRLEQTIVMLVLPACVVLSLLGPIVLKGRVFDIVNKILNTRLLLSKMFLIPENFSLFGVNVAEITNQSLTMDNSYVYTFIAYGAVPFAAIMIAYFLLMGSMVKKQQGKEVLMLLAILAAGLTEPFLFNTSFKNPSLLFLGAGLFAWLNRKQEKEIDLLKIGSKTVEPIEKWCDIGAQWQKRIRLSLQKNGKKAAAIAAVAAVAAVVIFRLTADFPERVLVPRKECADVSEESALYLEPEEIASYNDAWVLGYKDSETPMQEFSGNIILLERVRSSLASAGMAAGAVFGLMIIAGMRKEQTRNG